MKIISLFLLLGPPSLCRASLPASSNYSITAQTFSSATLRTSSSVFELYSSVTELPATQPSSTNFSSQTGFTQVSYLAQIFDAAILAIDPAWGYNTAPVNINKITGTNFSSGITVKLSASGEADISAADVSIVSSNEISCEFNITGAKAGFWDVVVTKEGESGSTLASGFEIKSYSFALNVAVNSPNPFDPARESTTIIYQLDRDTDINVYLFSVTGDMLWKESFNRGETGGKQGENAISWDGISSFSEMLSNGVYLLHIAERSTGKTLAKGKIAILRR